MEELPLGSLRVLGSKNDTLADGMSPRKVRTLPVVPQTNAQRDSSPCTVDHATCTPHTSCMRGNSRGVSAASSRSERSPDACQSSRRGLAARIPSNLSIQRFMRQHEVALCAHCSRVCPHFVQAPRLRVTRQDGNDGIHLAVSPVCGPLSGNTSDANAGINLGNIKTIVAFGVRSVFLTP